MTIIFQTDFSGIGSTQNLDDFDSTWVAHPESAATLRGYDGENRLECFNTSATRALFFNTTTGAIADCLVEIDLFIRTTGHEAAPVARMSETLNNCYGLRLSGQNLQLFRVVNGTYTQIGSSYALTVTAEETHRLGVRCVGNQITGTLNGVDVIGPITDDNVASGYPGIRALGTTIAPSLVDAFYVDNLGITPPDPAPPTGTVTIGTITPSATSASVSYSYSAGDATGFQYRLNGGTATTLGASPATISGLTASTTYSIEIRAINADGESAWSASAQLTTLATGDATPPTLTGSVTFASITQTSYTANWPAGSDTVGVTGYEYQIGSTAGAWTDAGNNLSAAITGRTAGTTETVYVRAYDAAGNRSSAISGGVTLWNALAAGINVIEPLKNNTGTVLANLSGVRVAVLQAADLVSVHESTGLTTNGSGILATISSAAITAGQQYHVAIKLADGSVGITGPVTAS